MCAFKWDYHLGKQEQRCIERHTPESQAKIHMAARADIEINRRPHRAGAVALTEHYLVLFKKKMLGKKFKRMLNVHFMSVVMASTRDDFTFCFETEKDAIKISTPIAMRLARNFMKNYFISGFNIAPTSRFSFKTHDMSHFPPFQPKISPSQAFQFAYNAYSSLYETTYAHDVTQYYHKLLSNTHCIFDLAQLPLAVISERFDDAIDVRALFQGLNGDSFIHGIACNGIDRPDAVRAVAPILGANKSLQVVSLRKCGAVDGILECAESMKLNRDIRISYWDLSDNAFDDMTPFIKRLKEYPNPIYYLNLSNTGLTDKNLSQIITYITENKQLAEIRHLLLSGAELSVENGQKLAQFVMSPAFKIRHLAITGPGVEKVLAALHQSRKTLESLSIRGTQAGRHTVNALISFLAATRDLTRLDISFTDMKESFLNAIIDEITKNKSLQYVTLVMDGLAVKKATINKFAETGDGKWNGFGFAKTTLAVDAQESLIRVLSMYQMFGELVLGCDCSAIYDRLGHMPISKLVIRNGGKIKHLMNGLKSNRSIRCLSLHKCELGDNGYQELSKVIDKNQTLQEVYVDRCGAETIEPVIATLDAVIASESIVSSRIGVDDMIDVVLAMGSKGRDVVHLYNDKEKKIREKELSNGCAIGVKHSLQVLGILELDQVVEDCLAEMRERLETVNIHCHSAICKVLDLPLPYQQANERYDGATGASVEETVDDSAANYQTMQFNSLIIKRDSPRVVASSNDFGFGGDSVLAPPSQFQNDDEDDED